MRVVLIGADGQLGTDLSRVLKKEDLVPLTISDLDVTDLAAVEKKMSEISPDVIIDTAAFHNVDVCEKEAKKALAVNALGPKHLAQSSKAKLVFISTDYVFDGEKGSPYLENDPVSPRSAYGISKVAGEQFVRYLNPRHFIVRVSSLFGTAGCMGKGGGNFVETMLRLGREKEEVKVVSDQVSSPTYTVHAAKKILQLIGTDHFGTFHVTNSGECSWYQFAGRIFDLAKLKAKLVSITSDEWKAPAHRPKYSVLRHGALASLKMDDMPKWEDAAAEYMKERGSV